MCTPLRRQWPNSSCVGYMGRQCATGSAWITISRYSDSGWEYVLQGACFGYRIIHPDCVSCYFQENYSSITKGNIGKRWERVESEISDSLLSVVDIPYMRVHPFGSVPKGHGK